MIKQCAALSSSRYKDYYTPLPFILANNNNKNNKQASKHGTFPFWLLLRPNALGPRLI